MASQQISTSFTGKNSNTIFIGWEVHCLYKNGEKEEIKIKFKIYISAHCFHKINLIIFNAGGNIIPFSIPFGIDKFERNGANFLNGGKLF